MITVLIADDEREIADLLALHLKKEGYHCIIVADGMEAVRAIQSKSIDLAILDIMMPVMDGYEAARLIRETHHLPIIFLSAKSTDLDKITGLVRGADDYITKPFNPMEVVARVNAQLRRALQFNPAAPPPPAAVLDTGVLVMNAEQRTVSVYGQPVDLTPKEFDILFLLASHPKKVFRSEDLFETVWKENYYEGSNTVMVHIRSLRKKLGEDTMKEKLIKTVWGVGYTFNG
ncbi:response regulator transcription factor [Paenibacillus daejeonensis]|uniref:response regulator transcription factor n=1 Tax=Paenibacillus daejeonensis TaxID=135193 RepID=UPI00036456EF|nr:response regulator transcription factor [Paenibacillus daejeonensis]